MAKIGTKLHIVEKSRSQTLTGNSETIIVSNKNKGHGVVYVDCGGGSRTGIILQAGEVDGQIVRISNISDAAETITFAAAATSNVASGTSMVVARYETVEFVWSETIGKWHGALGGGTTIADGAVTTAKLADGAATPAKTLNAEARTATAAPGGTTGVISDTTTFVTVTSDDANKVITLPTPTPGVMVVINNGATGYELRSSDPATIAINGGSGANAESAIAANSTVVAICISATAWKAFFLDADSDVAKVEAAAA